MAKPARGGFSALLLALVVATPARAGDSHTFDGRHDTTTVALTVVYLVPKDRVPLPDWRERVDYYTGRIARFHERESAGMSKLDVAVHPEPLVVDKTAEQLRGKEPNQTFYQSTGEAAKALGWPGAKPKGFPVLLVLSEINWRELDDFTRLAMKNGVPTHEGHVAADGRHFPGAESGGARAIYDANRGLGMGLVSADGWRVPYSGSDCVVYHEGLGHSLGLPHPEPGNDSVMGTAQYRYWINQTWIDPDQRAAFGWPRGDGPNPPDRSGSRDLFTAFTALQGPIVPRVGEPVALRLTWPRGAKLRSVQARIQTDLRGPWLALPAVAAGPPPETLPLGAFDRPTPVSYRVTARLDDGQEAEIWGYFQVKAADRR